MRAEIASAEPVDVHHSVQNFIVKGNYTMGTILLVFFGGLLVGCVFSVLSNVTQVAIFVVIPVVLIIACIVGFIVDPAFIEHRQLLAWATAGLIVGTAVGWWFMSAI